jgi:hypothetical protein
VVSLVYVQNPRVATRTFRGEAAFITPEDRRIHILNQTATEVWNLCAGEPMTVEDLCAAFEARYEGDPQEIRRDIEDLLNELVRMGALLGREPHETDTASPEGGAAEGARGRPEPENEAQ